MCSAVVLLSVRYWPYPCSEAICSQANDSFGGPGYHLSGLKVGLEAKTPKEHQAPPGTTENFWSVVQSRVGGFWTKVPDWLRLAQNRAANEDDPEGISREHGGN